MRKNDNIKRNIIFGYFFSFFFILLGVWPILFYGDRINLIFLLLSLVLFVITLLKPNFFTIPNILWTKLGFILGRFFAPIIMLSIYFFLIFPINLLLKILQKDILELKCNNSVKTYWKNRENKYSSMDNQF